jgi:hypothetical protein
MSQGAVLIFGAVLEPVFEWLITVSVGFSIFSSRKCFYPVPENWERGRSMVAGNPTRWVRRPDDLAAITT